MRSFSLIILILLFSCSKEEEPQPPECTDERGQIDFIVTVENQTDSVILYVVWYYVWIWGSVSAPGNGYNAPPDSTINREFITHYRIYRNCVNSFAGKDVFRQYDLRGGRGWITAPYLPENIEIIYPDGISEVSYDNGETKINAILRYK